MAPQKGMKNLLEKSGMDSKTALEAMVQAAVGMGLGYSEIVSGMELTDADVNQLRSDQQEDNLHRAADLASSSGPSARTLKNRRTKLRRRLAAKETENEIAAAPGDISSNQSIHALLERMMNRVPGLFLRIAQSMGFRNGDDFLAAALADGANWDQAVIASWRQFEESGNHPDHLSEPLDINSSSVNLAVSNGNHTDPHTEPLDINSSSVNPTADLPGNHPDHLDESLDINSSSVNPPADLPGNHPDHLDESLDINSSSVNPPADLPGNHPDHLDESLDINSSSVNPPADLPGNHPDPLAEQLRSPILTETARRNQRRNRRRKARRLAIQQAKQQASIQPSSQNTKSREHKIKEKNPTEIESGDKKGLQRLAEMVQKIDEKIEGTVWEMKDHSENTIQTAVSSVKKWSQNNFNSVNSQIRQTQESMLSLSEALSDLKKLCQSHVNSVHHQIHLTQENVLRLSQAINEELSLSRQNRSAQAAADAANSSRLISLGQDSSLRMLQYLTTSINSTTSDIHGKVGCMSDLILGMDPSDRKFVDRAQPILRQADRFLERLLNTTPGSPVAIIQSLRVSLKVLLVDDGFYELLL